MKLEKLKSKILFTQIDFVREIITSVWHKDVEDYTIDWNLDFIEIWDFCVPFSDFVRVADYKIPEEIFYEYQDAISLWYTSDRYKAFKSSLSDDIKDLWTLILFYWFCKKDDKDFIEKKNKDIQKAKERVEETREVLIESIKNYN